MIYFKNNNGGTIQVGNDTPRYLAQCLVNKELVEITKEEYDSLQPKEVEAVEPAKTYEQLVQEKIARKYSLADEIAIIRQIDQKPREFAEYYNYCEDCKREARAELNI